MAKRLKIFVIGTGATGAVLINTLARAPEVAELRCLTLDAKAARQGLRPSSKVRLVVGDVRNTTMAARLARGSTLVVNAASPWLNVPALKLALTVGTHYQDLEAYLGFDDGHKANPYSIEHLRFAREFKRRKLVALFDAGAAPGLSNLLVAEGVAAVGGRATRVTVRLVEDADSSTLVSFWSPAAAVDEVASRPVVWHRGHHRLIPRYSDPVPFTFPKPIGRQTTYSLMNNEAFTVPQYLNVQHMEVRSAGSDDEISRLMVNLGLLETKPVRVRGVMVSPVEFITKLMPPPPTPRQLKHLVASGQLKDAHFAAHIEVWRGRRSWRAWVHFPSQRELYRRRIYATYIGYPAGVCAAAFALELPRVTKFGAYPPEALPTDSRRRVFTNVRRLGIRLPRLP